MSDQQRFTVGPWLAEPSLDRIKCGSEVRSLRPQVMELLVYLANRPGEMVSTDDLLSELWDGRFVSDGSVYNCVSELRQSLARKDGEESAIETIPKKGYRLMAPVGPDPTAVTRQLAARRGPIAVTIAVTMILVAGLLYWLPKSDVSRFEIRSLAVLPLDNLSPNASRDEYFTDGMTEALIARLGQIEGLKVISRTSAMQLKNSDMTIPEIARELDVDGLIEGSVLTADREIRLTLQLIDGKTDTHLWTNSYVRNLGNILDLQEEIANSIASELYAQLVAPDSGSASQLSAKRRPLTGNADAYRAYLKARYYFNSFGEENFRLALELYDEAIVLDPEFALAYASRAEICTQPIVIMNRIRSLDDCRRDARRAITLDSNLPEAYAVLGFVLLFDWEWDQAERNLVRAIELNPNSVMARQWHAMALRISYRFDEALVEIRRAEELDPLNLFVRTMVSWPLYDQRLYTQALAQLDDVLEMNSDFMLAHYNRGLVFIRLHDAEKVFEAAARVAELGGKESLEARLLTASGNAISGRSEKAREILTGIERDGGVFLAAWIAGIYLMLGEEDKALSRLEQGLAEKAPDMVSISEPTFDAVRQNPRFRAVARKMGIPDTP